MRVGSNSHHVHKDMWRAGGYAAKVLSPNGSHNPQIGPETIREQLFLPVDKELSSDSCPREGSQQGSRGGGADLYMCSSQQRGCSRSIALRSKIIKIGGRRIIGRWNEHSTPRARWKVENWNR